MVFPGAHGLDLAREAEEIAYAFFVERDLGSKVQFTKAMLKVVPTRNYKQFLKTLFRTFPKYRFNLLRVQYLHQSGFNNNGLVNSFIRGLNHYWSPEIRERFAQLQRNVLRHTLPKQEVISLLNECVQLIRQRWDLPVVLLLDLPQIPFTVEGLRFVRELRNLAVVTDFQWLIVSSSPLLMLFMGVLESTSAFTFFNYRSKVPIRSRTVKVIYPAEIQEVRSGKRVGGDVVVLGTTSAADLFVSVWRTSTEIAIFGAENGHWIVIDLSLSLEFSIVYQMRTYPTEDAEGQRHLIIKWADIPLEVDLGDDFPEGHEVSLLSFTAYVRARRSNQPSLGVLPPRSVTRFRAIGPGGAQDFILVLPPPPG